jgi:hypothetical protein
MEIKPENFRALVRLTFESFKKLETELLKYRMVFYSMGAVMDIQDMMNQLLEQAAKNPGLEKQMREKYDVPLENFLKSIDEATQDQALEQWLRDWKPSGPIQ